MFKVQAGSPTPPSPPLKDTGLFHLARRPLRCTMAKEDTIETVRPAAACLGTVVWVGEREAGFVGSTSPSSFSECRVNGLPQFIR